MQNSSGQCDDDHLFRRYLGGDGSAFAQLFERHGPGVYRFARGMLADAALAEDVLQEAFLCVVRSARRYEARGTFRTWLLRITRNLCLNRIESRRVRLAQDLSGAEPARHQATPLDQLQSAEQLDIIRQRLQTLPGHQREATLLYAMGDLSYAQIADVLDVHLNTVKTLIHRARAALAQALDEYNGDNP